MASRSSKGDSTRVLIVDDEDSICDLLSDFLSMEGYGVASARDGVEAISILRSEHFDLVLTDLKMPRMGGIQLLEELSRLQIRPLSIIMTGFGTVETAIGAMKRGAYDYILKPFKLDEVLHVIQRAVEKQRMEAENIRLKEALSLYEVSEAISASLSLDEVIDTVITSCRDELRADLVSSWLVDEQGVLFERCRDTSRVPADGPEIGRVDSQAVAERLRDGDTPLLVHLEDTHKFFTTKVSSPLRSFVAVPLRAQKMSLGFIAVGTLHRRLEEGQRKLLSIIAARAAAAIDNARLYSDLQATFQQTIQGLASAIDKMDRYTAGHSDRVALHSVHLARRLGLSDEEVRLLKQSALMHDIGKIGCVLNLNKPGKLTDDEYEVFKLHPCYGRDILAPIKFLHPLIPGVQLHHERFDGRGYPLKLKGKEIPLMGRIIAVADTYDAMTSDRSYRRALPHEVAVAEIGRCMGTQFDPDVARPFIEGLDDYRDELNNRKKKKSV